MIVAVISKEKAEELKGQEYTQGVHFNPIQIQDKWIISLVEAQYLTIEDIVEIIDYVSEIEEDFVEEGKEVYNEVVQIENDNVISITEY